MQFMPPCRIPELKRRSKKWDHQQKFLNKSSYCDYANVGDAVAVHLTRDIAWLEEALRRTEFLPFANSPFSQRNNHYHDEKERIAEVFSEILIDSIEETLKDGKSECILLIVSGTSILPFFKRISSQVAERASRRRGTPSVDIITNNFAGALMIMRSEDQVDPPCSVPLLPETCRVSTRLSLERMQYNC
jgi:hypothetical protein